MTFDTTVSIPAVLMILGFAGAGITAWYNMRSQVGENARTIKDVRDLLGVANAKVAMALEKADEIRTKGERELAEYKLSVAKEYATANSIRLVEERVVAAIDRLGDRLDKVLDGARDQTRSRG